MFEIRYFGGFKLKKILTTITSILILPLVIGCSKNSTGQKSISKNLNANKVTTNYYQDLSKADKKKLTFKFKEAQDETKDNYADAVYVLSVKITNKTNKNVKFDKSKFIIFLSEQVKVTSDKSGILTVKPGQTKSINQLFENVPEQTLVDANGYFIYLNQDNKLASANFGDNSNKTDQDTESTNDSNSNASSSTTDNNQQQNNNQQTDNSNQNNIPTSDEALAKLKACSAPGWDTSDLTPSRGNNCWRFVSDMGLEWDSFDNGYVKGPGDPEPVPAVPYSEQEQDSDDSDD